MGVFEVTFVDRTNPLADRTKKRIAAKRLVVSTNVTSKTPLKIQFWLLGAVLGSKFAKITDRENATLYNMWSRRSAIERCPSPRNQIR